jgi:hypothetical protein
MLSKLLIAFLLINFSVDCGVGFTTTHEKGNQKVQSALEDTASECTRLLNNGSGLKANGDYKAENDTLRLYIEHCAQQRGSFHTFSDIDGAVQFMSDDNNRWLDYRTWLKKVLYLSLDSFYYCADVNSILHTFSYLRPGQGVDWNGSIAVVDYLLQNNRCPDSKAFLLKIRKGTRDDQVQIWRDSVKDSTKTPLDTSSVTLESLNLQILRGKQFAVAPTPVGHTGNAIVSFIATKNPFSDATVLRYEIADGAALRLEIYDELSREVYSEGEGMQESGGHEIQLEGNRFSSSTYYARLSTLSGEVRTIILKHLK